MSRSLLFAILFTSFSSSLIAAEIPATQDWTDQGVILSPGPAGSWDARLSGSISPSTIIKKNGTYYLYYVGADGNRSTDGGPRNRAMGVATSTDGINFTKYSGNPILTYQPHNNQEEGLFSAGVMQDDNGEILLYYSACLAPNSTSESVNCAGRLATSTNGLDFTDQGIVIDYADNSTWGAGDEIFPVGAYKENGTYYVYYIAKNGSINWDLGIASGTSRSNLSNSSPVLTSGNDIAGGTDPVRISDSEIAVFIYRRNGSVRETEVRTANVASPGNLSDPVVTYNMSNVKHTTVFPDNETNTWYMYYIDDTGSGVSVKTASTLPSGTNPIVTINGDNTKKNQGESVILTWTSSNSDSCTAAGSWTGTKALSGSETIGPLSTNSTFELTCNGTGGSTTKSVSVTVSQPQLSLTNTTPTIYTWDVMATGTSVYIDRTYTYSTIPADYLGLDVLQTANNDKGSTSPGFITFDVAEAVTVYVAHAADSASRPAWLSTWTDTGDQIVSSDRPLNIYRKDFAAGMVVLGGNEASALSMYTVMVAASGSTPAPTAPTVSLDATPTSVDFNGSSTLSWSSTNADSCTASGAWSGSRATTGSSNQTSLTADSTYTLTCTGSGGNASDSITVSVGAPPVPAPTVSLSASATSVAYNGNSTLSWSSTNADSCTASGAWSGSKGSAGSETQSGLTSSGTYSLSCSGAGGSASDSVSINVAAASSDSDSDGLADTWEQTHFGNLDRDGSGDQDGDGLSDLEEHGYGTNPTLTDSDGDGDSDRDEISYGTDPIHGTDTLDDHRPATPQVLPPGNNVSARDHTFDSNGFSDPDSNAQLGASEWQIGTDSSFSNTVLGRVLEGIESLQIKQGILKKGRSYAIRTRHRDNVGLWSAWSAAEPFTTASNDPHDADGDGIDDRYQVNEPVDTDENGVVDAEEGMCNLTSVDGAQVLGFRSNSGTILCATVVDGSELPAGTDTADFPSGMFSFSIEGLPVDANNPASVNVTVYFDSPLNNSTRWYKYDPSAGTVIDFTNNISINGKKVVITLTDGGLGDADGVVNGVIVDPSGPSFNANNTDTGGGGSASSDGGGGTTSMNELIFLALMLLLMSLAGRPVVFKRK